MQDILPLIDTILILISGISIIIGVIFIRNRRVNFHKYAMLNATTFAALFLIVYVMRYLLYGSKVFVGDGWILALYVVILTSHIILSIAIIPMVLMTLYRALKQRFQDHRRIARFVVPIWLYVVVTGWIIYLMLYHLPIESA